MPELPVVGDAPTKAASGAGGFVTKKIGPLPLWAWAGGLGVGFLVFRMVSGKGPSVTGTPVSATTGGSKGTGAGDTTPTPVLTPGAATGVGSLFAPAPAPPPVLIFQSPAPASPAVAPSGPGYGGDVLPAGPITWADWVTAGKSPPSSATPALAEVAPAPAAPPPVTVRSSYVGSTPAPAPTPAYVPPPAGDWLFGAAPGGGPYSPPAPPPPVTMLPDTSTAPGVTYTGPTEDQIAPAPVVSGGGGQRL